MNKWIPLAVAAVLLAGCTSGGDGSDGPTTIATAGASAGVRSAGPTATSGDTDKLDAKVKEFLGEFSALEELLDTYWSEQLEGYEGPAETLVFSGTGDDPKTWPTCDGDRVEAENGFYGPPDNTVILDADWMYAENTRVGDIFLYVVLAHEYGHSVQADFGTEDPHGTLASRASAFEYGRRDDPGACLTPEDYRR